jgi:hypothetical protein
MIRMAEPAGSGQVLASLDQGLFVYAIVGSSIELPDGLEGLDEATLRLVGHGQVAAVVAPVAAERPPGRRLDLLAYQSALDVLAEQAAVVPVRFGTLMPDDSAVVEEVLSPRHDQLVEMLEDLQGLRQFTFQAGYLETVVLTEIVEANPEIAELRAYTRELPEDLAYGERARLGELVARALEAKQAVDANLLLDVVLPHTAAHVIRPVSGLERLLDVSVLVESDRQPSFESALEELAEGVHERMRLRLIGPMAPYDFVGDV